MEQPLVYNTEQELINWLRDDLEYQRYQLTLNGVKREDIKDEDLILRIGGIINDFSERVKCNFILNFRDILTNVLVPKAPKEEDNNLIVCPYKVEVKFVDFEDFTNFAFIKFKSKVNFFESTFKLDANFQNCVFMEKAYFVVLDFKEKVNFAASIVAAEIKFAYVTFRNIGHFFKISLRSTVIFDNIIFGKDKGVLYLASIHVGDNNEKIKLDEGRENSKIEITNTVIDGRIDFHNVNIDILDLSNTVVNSGVVSTDNLNVKNYRSWKTARFLKHEAYKISNTIEGLKYKALEKVLYEKELKKEISVIGSKGSQQGDKNIVELYAELFSLMLSKLSNNHGQDWIKAVKFIFLTSFISVSLAYTSLISMKIFFVILVVYLWIPFYICLDRKNYIKKSVPPVLISLISFYFIYTYFNSNISLEIILITYFSYLTPTNLDLMKVVAGTLPNSNLNINSLNPFQLISFYFFYIFGKIAIGYGIFQVIQAFRKFNIK